MMMMTVLTPGAMAGGAVAIGLLTPQAAHAQVSTVGDVPRVVQQVIDFVLKGLVAAAKVGIKNALRSFLEKIAYDTAVWVASAGENQEPLAFVKEPGEYFTERADAAAGAFFSTLGEEGGFDYFNLCDLPDPSLKLNFQLILPQFTADEPYEPECTFSEQVNNVQDYAESLADQAVAFVEDPKSMINLSVSLGSGENSIASLLNAADQVLDSKKQEEREAAVEQIQSSLKAQKADISGYIQTPVAVIDGKLNSVLGQSTVGETTQQDNVIADALTIFINTLANKLMERLAGGLLAFFTESDISSSIAGDSSTSGSGGVKAAEEKFAEFKTPTFNPGGEIDILTQFASCPEQGADVTNCVINEGFRLAIEEGLTLNQAVNEFGYIDPSTPFALDSNGGTITSPTLGISLRNIRILRQYSVVPVGWELAAIYNDDFDGTPLTIGSVIDNYDDCDEGNYSPYCGLVDPDWPLKAPDVFCKLQGYATNIAAEEAIDDDGAVNTPEKLFTARLTSCLDPQSCLSEDENGFCEAYGYCVQQERIYRFEGDSCPSYYASCELFTDDAGNDQSLLQNTVNYDDCSVDNVGCQWRCRTYNEVDEAFQCSGQDEVYSTCDSGSSTYDSSALSCGCTAADASTCDITEGGFTCDTDTGESCTLGTETSADVDFDTTINFDDDVASCSSQDSGCTETIPVKGGANLLANGGFEFYDNADTDLAGPTDTAVDSPYDDSFGFSASSDASCTSYTNPQNCQGWELVSGSAVRAVNEALYGDSALQYDGDVAGGIVHRFATGQALENRSFSLSFTYNNIDANTCSVTGSIFADPATDTTWPGVSAMTESTDFDAGETSSSGFQTYTSDLVTFSAGVSATTVGVIFNTTGTGCDIVLDGVTLEENSGSSGISDYQNSDDLVYVNFNDANSCTVGEIGCNLYTPVTGESDTPIPGQITNPYSEACGDGSDYTGAECSQCVEETVGCDAFIEQETPYNAPINDVSGFSTYLDSSFDADLAEAIAQRTGYYCEDTTTPCSPDRETLDCGSGVSCLPSISIIPDTGTSCSANNVGCEQYVNLDQESLGGEGVEHYKYIRQCVKPTTQEIEDQEIDTYYTFEGSDISGYQLRSWYLKKSDVDAGPCTNLDLYGSTSETPTANCIDSDTLSANYNDCTASDIGDDPDCTEWFDSDGANYLRYKSSTITASDDCVPLRNTFDDRVYYSIPDESQSCPASANLCREYKGSAGGAVEFVIEEDFDDGAVWGDAEVSAETVTASAGLSMALGTSSTNAATSGATTVAGLVDEADSYVVTFWAKSDTDGSLIYPYFYSAETAETNFLSEDDIDLSTEWQKYSVGPFTFPEAVSGDEEFGFEYTDSYVYIDNVELQKNNSHYLILESADSCLGYEGCEEYTDEQDVTNYLKSFTNLCSDNVVGCEAIIKTQNSDTPFYTSYQADNEWSATNTPNDDVNIVADVATTIVITDSVQCDSSVAACELVGLPELDDSEDPQSYSAEYIINDPDSYDTILCEEHQRSCEQYTDSQGSTTYFKDPGEKYCEYNASLGQWLTPDGDACPLQNDSAEPSQPKGPICNGGLREDELCSTDNDCPADSSDSNTYRCISNDSADSGWVGRCTAPYSGCTLYVDPNMATMIDDFSAETNVKDNSDITSTTADDKPDGWGVASSASGANAFMNRDGASGVIPTPTGNSISEISYQSGDCDTFAQSTDFAFHRSNSLELKTKSGKNNCMAFPATLSAGVSNVLYPVDANKIYTLQAEVYGVTADAEFAIGLLYYDASGNELSNGLDVENYAIAAYEGGSRSDDEVPTDEWVHFHGTVGPNMSHSFPSSTYYVRVFVESGSDQAHVYFDNVGFAEDNQYTYLNHTVNGAAENPGDNTCNGEIDIQDGCVSFRDSNDNSLTSLAAIEDQQAVNSSFTDETCTFNDGEPSEACDSQANSSDTNIVIKVRNDRQCSEWLSCRSSRIIVNDAGEIDSETCFQIGRCLSRNEDTGVCTEWADTRDPDSLGSDDELRVTTQPGNTNDLLDIQDNSGFITIGAEWIGSCVSSVCEGGTNDGDACSVDSDCSASDIIYGYYPTDWMAEIGSGGAASTTDIVADGDFEDVTCNGDEAETVYGSDGLNYGQIAGGRNKSASCTLDEHCRVLEVETLLESKLGELEIEETTDDIGYWEGWCGNFQDNTFGTNSQWENYGGSSVSIIDYDEDRPYVGTSPINGGDLNVAALNVDLNNVLFVDPVSGQDSGVQVDVSDDIVQGQDYVVTFDGKWLETPDADSDFLQVALQYGSDEQNVDFFEVGSAKADIVFAVDTSSTMAGYISSVATNTTALVSGFDEAGVDYQVSIVTTGGSRYPKILDFADYSSTSSGFEYNANGTVTTDFTTDATEFSNAMTYISSNLNGGQVYNYEMMANIFDNSINNGTESLNFRPGAQKFIVLLTDTDPENGGQGDPYISGSSWAQSDENSFDNTYGGVNFSLYSVVPTSSQGYDALTASLGGTQYNISGTYSTIVSDITSKISESVSAFTLSESMESYAFGPLTIENKTDPADTSTLFIAATSNNAGKAFAIDNVSMKPSLEVRKEGNPQTENHPTSLARDCRAYPEQDSNSCDYQDSSGSIYSGWKGYCLLHDTVPGDSEDCVAWWPIDILSGEPDTTGRTRLTYSDKAPVYSCLVAKGNETLGACSSGGQICASDDDCSGSSNYCYGASDVDNDYDVSSSYTDGGYDMVNTYDSGGYRVNHNIESLRVESEAGEHTGDSTGNEEAAVFKKITDLPVEKLIHVSEIDRIVYDMGTPYYSSNDCNGSNKQNAWLEGSDGFDTADFEEYQTGGASEDDTTFFWQVGKDDDPGALCGGSLDEDLVYAVQKGAWCGTGSGDLCDENLTEAELDDIDFYYGKSITSQENQANIERSHSVWNGDSSSTSPFNPFNYYSVLGENGDAWNVAGAIDDDTDNGSVDGVSFSDNLFNSRYSDNDADTDSCFGHNPCGANVHLAKFDFQDGYLAAVYLVYWDGLARPDVQSIHDINWSIYLKEPCLLLVEGATEDGEATPWRTRATSSSGFQIPDLLYTYTISGPVDYSQLGAGSMYGSFSTTGNTRPDEEDGEENSTSGSDMYDFFAISQSNLPMVYLNGASGTTLPYACIGKCGDTRCQGDYTSSGGELDGSACTDDKWISLQGICSELDDDGNAQMCDDVSGCDNGSCTSLTYLDHQGAGQSTYASQLNKALEFGWEHYRLIFADIQGDVYYAPAAGSSGDDALRNAGELTSGDASLFSGFATAGNFSSMDVCDGSTRDSDEYCGIRPEVNHIELDNNDTGDLILQNGDTVSLTFDTAADADQEPVNTIKVAWFVDPDTTGDFSDASYLSDPWEAASTNGHSYSNTYTCDPTSAYYDKYALGGSSSEADYDPAWGACKYELWVEVTDNWNFCSGTEYTDITRTNDGTCTSYDSYDGNIYVRY
ncbi:MAG: hypothetical protein CO132_05840 [Candidatus Kerfeldbacteria bacterium CG_4_9_14_3_um_filter_45_8]|nr:MAG: hypothetical protein CO132_05840 [Candidatus Kerfeldbacteria bacterium CG_4_9_14_3_um_filter_45_8]